MPIKKSAIKRMRRDKKRHRWASDISSELKTRTKKVDSLLASKKMDQAREAAKQLISKLDKAAAKGIIHKNTASRRKSRLMRKISKVLIDIA